MQVRDLIEQAVTDVAASLVAPGDWLTGVQRAGAVREARDARVNPLDLARRAALSPAMVEGSHAATDELVAEAVEVLHRVASDPGRLTRSWADEMIAVLGEEVYVELVGIAASTAAIDLFAWMTSGTDARLGEPAPGDPADVGAWVSQSLGTSMANVSRSLSLVPVTNTAFVDLVQALYSRAEFPSLTWNRALSRPQVELVAARTTAELECFY